MSDLIGHYFITNVALLELQNESMHTPTGIAGLASCRSGGCGGSDPRQGELVTSTRHRWSNNVGAFLDVSIDPYASELPYAVIVRDVVDFWKANHWKLGVQKYHFMRDFNGQSQRDAYDSGRGWIRTNTIEAVRLMRHRLNEGRLVCRSVHGTRSRGSQQARLPVTHVCDYSSVLEGAPAQALGNAIHALEDSFAPLHVLREGIGREGDRSRPGTIQYIFAYEEPETHRIIDGKEYDHADLDKWWSNDDAPPAFRSGSPTGLSVLGLAAKDAVKALVKLVLEHVSTGSGYPQEDFDRFADFWLEPGNLSSEWNLHDQFIERFVNRYFLGFMSMDEAGMARALIAEHPTDTQFVRGVIERLELRFNTDSDDVAVVYVEEFLKPQNSATKYAVSQDRQLIDVLITALSGGAVWPDEARAIRELQRMKAQLTSPPLVPA